MTNVTAKLDYAKQQILMNMEQFAPHITVAKKEQFADELTALIDWTNPALMHKGFSWMTLRYLEKNRLVQYN